MKLKDHINKINNALGELGMRKAYDISWPKYNRYGFNFQRIAECSTALGLEEPEDVPCWDYWLETYRVTELFWKLWDWNGYNYRDLFEDYQISPVTKQVKAYERL